MIRPTDSKSVLRRYVAAVEAGDEDAIRELFAEDATWTLRAGGLPISGTWTGREAIIGEFLATAMAYYEPGSVSLEITGMIAEGDRVVLQWTSRARTRDRAALRERLHRRLHHPRRKDPRGPRVHGHAVRRRGRVLGVRQLGDRGRGRAVIMRIFVAGASGVIGVRLRTAPGGGRARRSPAMTRSPAQGRRS